MLKLTKRADYGMMAMRYLAEHPHGGPYSARDIAESSKIPLPVLAKTLQTLARAELVASLQGATGGYFLSRAADRISAFEIISAFDGPPVITNCVSEGHSCDMISRCSVKEPLQQVNERIRELLCSITVADLASRRGPAPDSEVLVTISGTELAADLKCPHSNV